MAGRPSQRPATGSRGRTTRPGGWRNLIVGLVFIAIGVSVFLIAQGPVRWQVGGAGVFLGLFIAVTLGPWSGQQIQSPGLAEMYASLDGLIDDLGLEGPAYYLAAGSQPNLTEDRVFIAEHEISFDQLPSLDATTTLYPDKPRGIAIHPPGKGLLEEHEAALGIDTTVLGVAELSTTLGSMLPSKRLFRRLAIRQKGKSLTVRYEPQDVIADVEGLGGSGQGLVGRTGPVAGSAVLLALSRATGQAVRLDSVIKNDRDEVEMEVGLPG